MQEYYDTYGLIKFGKCMYCLKDLDGLSEKDTAEHFATWCKVMPDHLMLAAEEQWEYTEKLIEAGWYSSKAKGLKPPAILGDGRPGRENRKRKSRRIKQI